MQKIQVQQAQKAIQRVKPGSWAVFDESGNQIGSVAGGKGYYKAIRAGKKVGEASTKNAAAKILLADSVAA